MSEFDAEYEQRMAEARTRAGGRGRNDVLDYLSLREVNDRARAGGIEWLFEIFTTLAGEANRAGAGINLVHTDAHRFRVGNSTMVGSQLVLRLGVRALTIEAGWPRTPRDGIVRGGGLASAKLSHFGNLPAGEELLLVPRAGEAARWFVLENTGGRNEFSEDRALRHVVLLAGRK